MKPVLNDFSVLVWIVLGSFRLRFYAPGLLGHPLRVVWGGRV